VEETKQRACAMLLDCVAGGARPFVAWARIPVLLPGERTSTVEEPAKSLYARLPGLDGRAGILDANIMVGFVWADEPRSTACAVVTGTDRDAMARAVGELSAAYFAIRDDFRFGPVTDTLETCLDRIEASMTRPVVLSDSGDNPTAGGVADRAEVLGALIARGFQDALVAGIADRPAVEACYAAGVGATLRLRIGATLNPGDSTPVEAMATVLALAPDAAGDMGEERQAAVRIGGITAILAARRRPYYNRADYDPTGLDPAAFRLLVVKLGYLMPDLAAIANPALMALTTGVVDQDIPRLPVRHIHRPTFPWDKDFTYMPDIIFSVRAP
jgi:microcystin degradation protein MlrC